MGDFAIDSTTDPLAINGFEELLEPDPGLAPPSTSTPLSEPGSAQGLASGVPVADAARRLGISTNAVLKRLRKGKLKGQKAIGQFGEYWLVDIADIPEPIEIKLETEPGSAQGSAQQLEDEKQAEPGLASSNELLQLVVQLSKENGALQALLRERDIHIKLLTDQKHKQNWWQRAWSWFIGEKK